MSVGKNFSITERIGFHWEAQFANLFDVQNYATPNMNLSSAFGKSARCRTSTGGPRTIQMTLRLYF